MKLQQVEFKNKNRHKVVWVEKRWNLKPGMTVDFEDEYNEENPQIWTVEKVYPIVTLEYEEIYSKWGLDLPKTFRTER